MTPNRYQERKVVGFALFLLLLFGIHNNRTTITILKETTSSLAFSIAHEQDVIKRITTMSHPMHQNLSSSHDGIIEESPKERPLNPVSETTRRHLSTWATLWRDSIPEDINTKPDVSLTERAKRWKQLSDQTQASTKHMQDLFASFPLPEDSIVVYNQDPYQELISNLVQAQNEDRNFTIVANGGWRWESIGATRTPLLLQICCILECDTFEESSK